MNTEPIRRRSNGTIDIDFYRARALRERAATMTDAGRIARAMRTLFTAVRHFAGTPVPARSLPDPGAMMLIAHAVSKRPPV